MSTGYSPSSFSLPTWLVRHSGKVLLAFAVVTAALIPAALWLASDEIASAEPGGEAFDLRDDLERKLATPNFPTAYLVEARDGDVLTQRTLWELHQAQRALLEADRRGELVPDGQDAQPLLMDSFDPNSGVSFRGMVTIADAVDQMLRFNPTLNTDLEHASDDQVKFAVSALLQSPRTAELADQLSVKATRKPGILQGKEFDYWVSPALVFIVLADNEALGGGSSGSVGSLVGDDATIAKERFSRHVQRVLRGTERHYRLWGIAIDQNLEALEEGTTAGLFIMLTVIAALGVVGIALRSYWATALTAVGIGVLMVWLKGITGLVGIKGGLIIEFIVPIAMVSLGVDFAVHAIRRYKEERSRGHAPNAALTVGFGGVLGALTLAMVSDSIAFLSNVPSGIEAVMHFGLAAGIAVLSAFVVLGLVVPLALMRIEGMCPVPGTSSPRQRIALGVAGLGVSMLCGVAVILIVALSMPAGIAVLLATTIGFLILPVVYLGRRAPTSAPSTSPKPYEPSWVSYSMSVLAIRSTHHPLMNLALAATITALSVVLALRLDAVMDVKDFFRSDADFVVGLDKIDEHIADRSGEGGTIYIRGDLTQPQALRAVDEFMNGLTENSYVGTEADGEPSILDRNVVGMVRHMSANSMLVASQLKGPLQDSDGDGLPDNQDQIRALLNYATLNGVPLAEPGGEVVYTAEDVGAAVYHEPFSTNEDVAAIIVGIPGTRELKVVAQAKSALERDLVPLAQTPGISHVGLTGSPFTRNAEVTATTRSLRTSMAIAAVSALIVLAVAMRSIRYAIVTVIPIGLVVAWLYAIMFLFGFALNIVTATIGAVSIGVGIDYSIHMTERFREELGRSRNPTTALAQAASGTGTALLASAGSSIVGFAIMGFAPMPMFSTYGILTAVMIFLALAASLLVLPSLLLLAAGAKRTIRSQVR